MLSAYQKLASKANITKPPRQRKRLYFGKSRLKMRAVIKATATLSMPNNKAERAMPSFGANTKGNSKDTAKAPK